MSLNHKIWREFEAARIERHAQASIYEIRCMANDALDAINGSVHFFNRSLAQKRRWANFRKFNGRAQ